MPDIKVPELGESIIDGTLTSWLVSEGSSFQAGDNLAEIETEKITIEIPAQSSGKLSKILIHCVIIPNFYSFLDIFCSDITLVLMVTTMFKQEENVNKST